MRKPNLQKRSLPDLFSKRRGNISVTIALKGQGTTRQCLSSAFLGKRSLEHARAVKKGPEHFLCVVFTSGDRPRSGSYVLGCQNTSKQRQSLPQRQLDDGQLDDRQTLKRQQVNDPICQKSPLCLGNYRSVFLKNNSSVKIKNRTLLLYSHSVCIPLLFQSSFLIITLVMGSAHLILA